MDIDYKFITMITVIVVIFGSFGGIINYLMGQESNNKSGRSMLKSIVLGIGASFLVPLFLNLLSSNIINKDSGKEDNLLVFAGLCLIAAISSNNFIGSISNILFKRTEEIIQSDEKKENVVNNESTTTTSEFQANKSDMQDTPNNNTISV